jgi:hypothetical protein
MNCPVQETETKKEGWNFIRLCDMHRFTGAAFSLLQQDVIKVKNDALG